VKAHIAKLMRKAGVHNRLALSVHAVYTFAGFLLVKSKLNFSRTPACLGSPAGGTLASFYAFLLK